MKNNQRKGTHKRVQIRNLVKKAQDNDQCNKVLIRKCGRNYVEIVPKNSIELISLEVSPNITPRKRHKATLTIAHYLTKSSITSLKRMGQDIIEIYEVK